MGKIVCVPYIPNPLNPPPEVTRQILERLSLRTGVSMEQIEAMPASGQEDFIKTHRRAYGAGFRDHPIPEWARKRYEKRMARNKKKAMALQASADLLRTKPEALQARTGVVAAALT